MWQVGPCVVLCCPITAGRLSQDLHADSTLIYGTITLVFSSRTSETSASPGMLFRIDDYHQISPVGRFLTLLNVDKYTSGINSKWQAHKGARSGWSASVYRSLALRLATPPPLRIFQLQQQLKASHRKEAKQQDLNWNPSLCSDCRCDDRQTHKLLLSFAEWCSTQRLIWPF